MEEPMNPKKIPQTDSIQELAQFWDTHDSTDFEDELEEVQAPIFNSRVTVSLTTEEIKIVTDIAEARGIFPRQLIQEWITERIETLSTTAT